ncbi:hypothetical protein [Pseudomonas mandelii]|uniref:hypothetical protein n=1 Tax=Pseudomonas mandelii TaxID=75612 RepID=UPI00209FD613|nr:hypothetical protein [Pseudomonas mandelii]MCO8309652.1 hypothetical protein [Pseudomonas mandelii]
MAGSREIALEQALVAVIAAAETSDVDVHALLGKASAFILDSGSRFQIAGHPYGTKACQEISDAHATVLANKDD